MLFSVFPSRRQYSIVLLPFQPGQVKVTLWNLEGSPGKGRVVEIDRLSIHVNHDDSLIRVLCPVGQLTSPDWNDDRPTIREKSVQHRKCTFLKDDCNSQCLQAGDIKNGAPDWVSIRNTLSRRR